jgi:hypothetical protein
MADMEEVFPVENDQREVGWEGNRTTNELTTLAGTQGATLRAAVKAAKMGYATLLHRFIIEVDAMIDRGVSYNDLPEIPAFAADDLITFSPEEILDRVRDLDSTRPFTVSLNYFFFVFFLCFPTGLG